MNEEVRKFIQSAEKVKTFEYHGKCQNAITDFLHWGDIFLPLRYCLFFLPRIFPIPPFYRWIYRLFGVKIGKSVFFGPDVVIDYSYQQLIEIGDNCILGWGAKILTHEGYLKHFTIGRVKIGNNVVIGAFSTIRCGVTIGDNAIIAMGSLVDKDIPPNRVVGGVPAHRIKKLKKLF